MPENLQRPFVPHRTPGSSRQIGANSEFQLARPFIPSRTPIASIGEYLDAGRDYHPQTVFAEAAQAQDGFEVDGSPDELPPIEHFTDPLPPAVSFAPDDAAERAHAEFRRDDAFHATDVVQDESSWKEDDWQRYDWRAAAALGDEPASEASNEWATTDWEVSAPVTRDRKPTAAEAIATALDEIAQRIRQGDLAVPATETLANPAAIAASLAALLGVKR